MGLVGCNLDDVDDSWHKCKMESDDSLKGKFTTSIFNYSEPKVDIERYHDGYCPKGTTCFPVQNMDKIWACSDCSGNWQLNCGECIDVRFNNDNCGMCGNKCSEAQKCVDGNCVNKNVCTNHCKDDRTLSQCQSDGSTKDILCDFGCAAGGCKTDAVDTCSNSCKNDQILLECQEDKSTKEVTCPNGCLSGVCQNGEVQSCRNQCKGENILIVCEDNGTTREVECPNGCDSNANACRTDSGQTCSDSCSSDGMTLLECQQDGSIKEVQCTNGCENNACKTAVNKKENGEQCQNDDDCNSGFCDDNKMCAEKGGGDACHNTCKNDNTLLECQGDGSVAEVKCNDGCKDGICVEAPPCLDGKTCSGNRLILCKDGSVVETVNCTAGCDSAKNVCNPDADGDGITDDKDECPYNGDPSLVSASQCNNLIKDGAFHIYHARNLQELASWVKTGQTTKATKIIFHNDINLAEINGPIASSCDEKLFPEPPIGSIYSVSIETVDKKAKTIRYEVNGKRCSFNHPLFISLSKVNVSHLILDFDSTARAMLTNNINAGSGGTDNYYYKDITIRGNLTTDSTSCVGGLTAELTGDYSVTTKNCNRNIIFTDVTADELFITVNGNGKQGAKATGGLVGQANCLEFSGDSTREHIMNGIVSYNNVGGVIGESENVVFRTNQPFKVTTKKIQGGDSIGGLIGKNTYKATIENVQVNNNELSKTDKSIISLFINYGGLVGNSALPLSPETPDNDTVKLLLQAKLAIKNARVHTNKIIAADGLGGLVGNMNTDVSVENTHVETLNIASSRSVSVEMNDGMGGLVGIHSYQKAYDSKHVALLNVKNVSVYSYIKKSEKKDGYSCGLVCARQLSNDNVFSTVGLSNIAVVSATDNSTIYGIADTLEPATSNIYYESLVNIGSKDESRVFMPWKNTPQKTGTAAMCENVSMNQSCNTSSYTTELNKADNNSGKWVQGTFNGLKYPQYKPF